MWSTAGRWGSSDSARRSSSAPCPATGIVVARDMGSPRPAPPPGLSPGTAAAVSSCCLDLRGMVAFWHPATVIATAPMATLSRSSGRNCASFSSPVGQQRRHVEPRMDVSARWPPRSYAIPSSSISVCPGVKIDRWVKVLSELAPCQCRVPAGTNATSPGSRG